MDPILTAALQEFLIKTLKEVIPDKDVNVELTVKIQIITPKTYINLDKTNE